MFRGVTLTQALLELFAQRRVFHRPYSGARWVAGEELRVDQDCELEPYSHFHFGQVLPQRMGAFSYANSQFALPRTRVGRYTSIGQRVLWLGPQHPLDWATTSPFPYEPRGTQGVKAYLVDKGVSYFPPHEFDLHSEYGIQIGNDVWIGDEVAIRDGVTIGDGAVVAARAVVTRDVPPYAIVAGVPARTVRLRFPERLVERFQASRWWRFGPDQLQPLDVRQPEGFLDGLERENLLELTLAPLTAAEIFSCAAHAAM